MRTRRARHQPPVVWSSVEHTNFARMTAVQSLTRSVQPLRCFQRTTQTTSLLKSNDIGGVLNTLTERPAILLRRAVSRASPAAGHTSVDLHKANASTSSRWRMRDYKRDVRRRYQLLV